MTAALAVWAIVAASLVVVLAVVVAVCLTPARGPQDPEWEDGEGG